MSRKQPKTLPQKEKNELLNELWSSVTLLDTKDEVENFFRDLLSQTEALMLARRVRIARHLLEGKSYEDIQKNMSTSYSTIASVHRWLQDSNEGYEETLPKLQKELEKKKKHQKKHHQSKKQKYPEPYTFEWLKKKYPLHFLLFNLLDDADELTRKYKKD